MTDQARPPFDLDAAFDADYLAFYGQYTTDDRSDDEAALIGGLLGLRPGEKVLDLACGAGRIAMRLAMGGCAVTGLDRSELFLAQARVDAAQRGVDALWVHGDQRRLHFTDEFDAVFSWFTSFGYDDDATSKEILRRIHGSLVPGGRFLIETMNLFQIAFDDAQEEPKTVGRDRMSDVKRFDPLGGFIVYDRSVVRAGRTTRKFTFSVRLFAPAELRSWLEAAGFVDVRAYGADGEPFDVESERLILVARKPA